MPGRENGIQKAGRVAQQSTLKRFKCGTEGKEDRQARPETERWPRANLCEASGVTRDGGTIHRSV